MDTDTKARAADMDAPDLRGLAIITAGVSVLAGLSWAILLI